jgi:hypothetical protein
MYGFASLDDLANGRPSSFTRTLNEPLREGAAWSGFASLGDQWRVTPLLKVVLGVRLEGDRFLRRPAYNAALDSALGLRTDVAPSRVHASPRLGFSWRFGGAKGGYTGYGGGPLGTRLTPPSGLLRGGIGEFRAGVPVDLLSGASAHTGLATSARQVSCVGTTVPTPDWAAFVAGLPAPDACTAADGTSPLSDSTRSISLFHPSFDVPRSWRLNLGLSSMYRWLAYSIDATVSLNLNQPSVTNANLAPAPQFALADEGRPVYARPIAIVPSSGSVAALDSRIVPTIGPVLVQRSDLRSVSRQLSIVLTPQTSIMRRMLSAAYTLSKTSADLRDIDVASFGDPNAVNRAQRGTYDIRHRLQVQMAQQLPKGFSFTLFLVASSGLPFTPLVAGDVNGDGVSPDRAFVHDPRLAVESSVRDGMQQLLSGAAPRIRKCLERQLGGIAHINSCEGPWFTSTTARLTLANAAGPWGRRVNAALSISNPLAGIDRLLHGSRHLRGWGTFPSVDPVLYRVREFVPGESRFRYDVNSHFGRIGAAGGQLRAPFGVALDVSFDLGPPIGRQQLERAMNRGRKGRPGPRLGADSIRIRFARNVPSPYKLILWQSDSLLLSRQQVAELRAADAQYSLRVDSLWTHLGQTLAAMGDEYDAGDATRQTEETTDQVWEAARAEMPIIQKILSPLQMALAPGAVKYLAAVKGKIRLRSYSY